jgi:nitrate reductase molybdenum cofactor assembly chaperone NarJ/NarW
VLTFRILSALLSYPTPELKAQLADAERILRSEGLLGMPQLEGVCTFLNYLGASPQLDAESAYLDAFDRGRSTSLYLFEHIHGESRERGQAMVKLLLRYRAHGLDPSTRELPDYLPLFLEFLSTRPPADAARHLAEVVDIVVLIGERLRRRGAPHAALLEAVASIAPQRTGIAASDVEPDRMDRDDTPAALDAAWEEAPVVFNDAQGAPVAS